MAEINFTKESKEAGIAFCLPGELVFGYLEEPGKQNPALCCAIEDTIKFFLERLAHYQMAAETLIKQREPAPEIPGTTVKDDEIKELERLMGL